MQNRRDFLKTATLAAIGSGLGIHNVFAGKSGPALFSVNKLGKGGRMKMRFFPYELKLKHVFAVASYSRTTRCTGGDRVRRGDRIRRSLYAALSGSDGGYRNGISAESRSGAV